MKNSILLLMAAVSLSLAADTPSKTTADSNPEFRTERQERTRDGKVVAETETVYHGNQKVLVTVKLAKNKRGMLLVRDFFSDGKEVMSEMHYEDGTQVVRFYKAGALSEMFRRKADGSVEPISRKDLATHQERQKELLELLKK